MKLIQFQDGPTLYQILGPGQLNELSRLSVHTSLRLVWPDDRSEDWLSGADNPSRPRGPLALSCRPTVSGNLSFVQPEIRVMNVFEPFFRSGSGSCKPGPQSGQGSGRLWSRTAMVFQRATASSLLQAHAIPPEYEGAKCSQVLFVLGAVERPVPEVVPVANDPRCQTAARRVFA